MSRETAAPRPQDGDAGNVPERTGTMGRMVGWEGLEPSTNALKGHCSTD